MKRVAIALAVAAVVLTAVTVRGCNDRGPYGLITL